MIIILSITTPFKNLKAQYPPTNNLLKFNKVQKCLDSINVIIK